MKQIALLVNMLCYVVDITFSPYLWYRGDFPFSPLVLWSEQKVERLA